MMISRAGKFTQEKHMILQRMDEILSGSEKKFHVKSSSLAKLSDKV
jgi:hypothetical protein